MARHRHVRTHRRIASPAARTDIVTSDVDHRESVGMGFTGTITGFDRTKGFGFVSDPESPESDIDVFVHVNSLNDPAEKHAFGNGTIIEFDIEDSDRGPRAENVQVIDSSSGRMDKALLSQLIIDKLLAADPSMTGQQLINARTAMIDLAVQHDWIDH